MKIIDENLIRKFFAYQSDEGELRLTFSEEAVEVLLYVKEEIETLNKVYEKAIDDITYTPSNYTEHKPKKTKSKQKKVRFK